MEREPRPRVAVLGAGGAGLATAWLLEEDFEVVIFEAEPEPGGHARTVLVDHQGAVTPVETGFRYFFRGPTYPKLLALLALLDQPVWERNTTMSLRRGGRRTLMLPPTHWSHLPGLLEGTALRELLSLQRLLRGDDALLASGDFSLTLSQWLASNGFSDAFRDELLVPFLAASWGAPLDRIPSWPAYSVHRVLRTKAGAHLVIPGGVGAYIQRLLARLTHATLRCSHRVQAVHAHPEGGLQVDGERFDHVVLAAGAHTSAAVLPTTGPLGARRALLEQFEHFDAHICIHTDASAMPRDRRNWADLNHTHTPEVAFMTEWYGGISGAEVFRTWLPPGADAPEGVVLQRRFRHLVLDTQHGARQRALQQAQGAEGLFTAGMHCVDVDNHESALWSAWQVCQALHPGSRRLSLWRAAADRGACPRLLAGNPLGG